eukprot:NODE_1421_length_605_cov_374.872302_g1118_i1.p1 GENE.NODE_1421_length_605_cov_374.872302_g1118_i1~~NODE_1421_length_605_cov_374.872302_g1118_i1.p1  ORF type:complete len:142 (-),score=17.36 NODE_1421_length_605_cov_374.872302_g1118_i1:52-477(-)
MESSLTVCDESAPSQRGSQNRQQYSQRRQRQRAITGQRRPAWMPLNKSFGLHVPTLKDDEQTMKKRRVCDEMQESTTTLVKATLGQLTRDEAHSKKFSREIDSSKAFPELLKSHLGFVNDLPETLQLVTLIGEKWLRTRWF